MGQKITKRRTSSMSQSVSNVRPDATIYDDWLEEELFDLAIARKLDIDEKFMNERIVLIALLDAWDRGNASMVASGNHQVGSHKLGTSQASRNSQSQLNWQFQQEMSQQQYPDNLNSRQAGSRWGSISMQQQLQLQQSQQMQVGGSSSSTSQAYAHGDGVSLHQNLTQHQHLRTSTSSLGGSWQQYVDHSPSSLITSLRNIEGQMGVDIGGTLAKMVILLPVNVWKWNPVPAWFGRTGRTHEKLEVRFSLDFGQNGSNGSGAGAGHGNPGSFNLHDCRRVSQTEYQEQDLGEEVDKNYKSDEKLTLKPSKDEDWNWLWSSNQNDWSASVPNKDCQDENEQSCQNQEQVKSKDKNQQQWEWDNNSWWEVWWIPQRRLSQQSNSSQPVDQELGLAQLQWQLIDQVQENENTTPGGSWNNQLFQACVNKYRYQRSKSILEKSPPEIKFVNNAPRSPMLGVATAPEDDINMKLISKGQGQQWYGQEVKTRSQSMHNLSMNRRQFSNTDIPYVSLDEDEALLSKSQTEGDTYEKLKWVQQNHSQTQISQYQATDLNDVKVNFNNTSGKKQSISNADNEQWRWDNQVKQNQNLVPNSDEKSQTSKSSNQSSLKMELTGLSPLKPDEKEESAKTELQKQNSKIEDYEKDQNVKTKWQVNLNHLDFEASPINNNSDDINNAFSSSAINHQDQNQQSPGKHQYSDARSQSTSTSKSVCSSNSKENDENIENNSKTDLKDKDDNTNTNTDIKTTSQQSSNKKEYVLRFMSGHTAGVEELVTSLKDSAPFKNWVPRSITVAGGGAHKYQQLFLDALNLKFEIYKEMQSVVEGLHFVLERPHVFQNEVVVITNKGEEVPHEYDEFNNNMWDDPKLVVNIGTGVSILHVRPDGFTRVGGTWCGGGTFLGLTRLLCGTQHYDDALHMASKGDASNIDTLVRDIYGEEGSQQLGLPANLTASNFGKIGIETDPNRKRSPNDLARACLQLVIQQVSVLALAFSKTLDIQQIFFVGGFLERNKVAKTMIADSMRRLGNQAYFAKHSDFLGALGSLAYSLRNSDIPI